MTKEQMCRLTRDARRRANADHAEDVAAYGRRRIFPTPSGVVIGNAREHLYEAIENDDWSRVADAVVALESLYNPVLTRWDKYR